MAASLSARTDSTLAAMAEPNKAFLNKTFKGRLDLELHPSCRFVRFTVDNLTVTSSPITRLPHRHRRLPTCASSGFI